MRLQLSLELAALFIVDLTLFLRRENSEMGFLVFLVFWFFFFLSSFFVEYFYINNIQSSGCLNELSLSISVYLHMSRVCTFR